MLDLRGANAIAVDQESPADGLRPELEGVDARFGQRTEDDVGPAPVRAAVAGRCAGERHGVDRPAEREPRVVRRAESVEDRASFDRVWKGVTTDAEEPLGLGECVVEL